MMADMSLVEQAKSIIGTIAAGLKDHRIMAGQEVVEERLAVCEACPKLIFKEKRGQKWYACKVCGCSYKRKVAVHGSSCPLGKW